MIPFAYAPMHQLEVQAQVKKKQMRKLKLDMIDIWNQSGIFFYFLF